MSVGTVFVLRLLGPRRAYYLALAALESARMEADIIARLKLTHPRWYSRSDIRSRQLRGSFAYRPE